MSKLEDANLGHTIVSNNNATEGTEEKMLNVKTVTAKDDSKARRIIYKHLSEETWTEIEDIDTAFELWDYLKARYSETEEEESTTFDGETSTEKFTTLDGKISTKETTTTLETIAANEKEYEKVKEEEESTTFDGETSTEKFTTLDGKISTKETTTTAETIAANEKEYEKVKEEEEENETTTLNNEVPTEAINKESFLIEEKTKYSMKEKNENKLLINNSLREPGNDNLNKIVYLDINFELKDNDDNAKSTSRQKIYIGSAPIHRKSKRRKSIARSTNETIFNITTDFIKRFIWLNNSKREIGDFALIMNHLKKVFINVLHINSNDMLVDILTKKIKVESFNYFINNTSNH